MHYNDCVWLCLRSIHGRWPDLGYTRASKRRTYFRSGVLVQYRPTNTYLLGAVGSHSHRPSTHRVLKMSKELGNTYIWVKLMGWGMPSQTQMLISVHRGTEMAKSWLAQCVWWTLSLQQRPTVVTFFVVSFCSGYYLFQQMNWNCCYGLVLRAPFILLISGRCFVTYWSYGNWRGAVRCPVCRQQVECPVFHVAHSGALCEEWELSLPKLIGSLYS